MKTLITGGTGLIGSAIESNYFDITRLPYQFLYNDNKDKVYKVNHNEENNILSNTCNDDEFDNYIVKLLKNNNYITKDNYIYNNTIFPNIENDNIINKNTIIESFDKFIPRHTKPIWAITSVKMTPGVTGVSLKCPL